MAIIPVAEEVATSTGLLSWLARGTSIAAPLADLLFGAGHTEPARNNSIGPVAALLRAPQIVLHDLFAAINSLAAHLYDTLVINYGKININLRQEAATRSRQVFWALTKATDAVKSEAATRQRTVLWALGKATDAVKAEAATRQRTILWALDQAIGAAKSVESRSANLVKAEASNRARSDQWVLGQARAIGAAGRTYADTVSTRAAARATTKLSTDGADAFAPAWQGVRSDLEAAAAVFGVGQPAITSLIKQLPVTMPAGLPGAEAATGKALRVLTKTMEDCVAPNCRDTSKFGKDLQKLFALAEGAAFLAFLAYIIKDPDNAVRETFDVMDDITHTTIDGIRNLVGS